MPLAFENPWWLLLAPPVIIWIWWIDKTSRKGHGVAKRRWLLILRALTVLLLTIALAGASIVRTNHRLNVIIVADASTSVGQAGLAKERTFIKAALAHHKPEDRTALLYFGSNTEQVTPLSSRSIQIPELPNIDPAATDIEAAVQQAEALLKTRHGERRIVLISDGNENRGSAMNAVNSLLSSNIELDTVPLQDNFGPEALVRNVHIPHDVKIGEPFRLRVTLESTVRQTATISLLRNGAAVEPPQGLQLHRGLTTITVPQTIHHPGAYRYTVLMHAPHDEITENNRGVGYVWVRGKPRVLYVADSSTLTSFLRSTMRQHQIEVQYLPPADVPTSAADLQGYDAVLLSNVPANELSHEQMRAMQTACRDLGIGLAMVGGDASFGAGGYRGTPIEEALPVSMDIKAQRKLPSVAVALVMEDLEMPSAVNISIQAAQSVVHLLQPIDQMGVLDCNGFGFGGTENATAAGRWRIPMQHVTNPRAIQAQMQNLTDMGDPPTYVPYLREAARELNGTNAAVKHIIFVGDGDAIFEGDQGNLARALRQITAMGITVSTIASGADLQGQQFLRDIAELGGGSSFVADQPQELPRLLLRDAINTTEPPVVLRPTIPQETTTDTVLTGIPWNSAPPLLGYNVTTPKPTANIDLIDSTPGSNNVLYAWQQYGLGRSLAFMSDDRAKWAALWLRWSGYSRFWSQTIRWILRPSPPSSFHLAVSRHGSTGQIDLSAITPAGEYINNLHILADVTLPDGGKTGHIQLQQTAPGRYSGEFPIIEYGTYLVSASASDQKQFPGSVQSGVSMAYPDEYRTITSRPQLLQQLSRITKGRYNLPPSAVFRNRNSPSRVLKSITNPLLDVALVVFLLDVAFRRITFLNRTFSPTAQAAVSTPAISTRQSVANDIEVAASHSSQSNTAGLTRLKQARERARSQFQQDSLPPDADEPRD